MVLNSTTGPCIGTEQHPGPEYVGLPNPQLDSAWDQLIRTRYLAFTEEQRSSFAVEMSRSYQDGLYRAGKIKELKGEEEGGKKVERARSVFYVDVTERREDGVLGR